MHVSAANTLRDYLPTSSSDQESRTSLFCPLLDHLGKVVSSFLQASGEILNVGGGYLFVQVF